MAPATSLPALLVVAALTGVGFVGAPHRSVSTENLGGFGGPVGHVRIEPMYRERTVSSTASIRQIRCVASAPGDSSSCYAFVKGH